MKKFELTDQTITLRNKKTLYRIRACKSFSDVKEGDLGGYVEHESNLSQGGNAWIYDNACVYQDAYVFNSACLYDNAKAFGDARIYGNAQLYDNAEVFGKVNVFGNARLYNAVEVTGQATILDNAILRDNARVFENAIVAGHAQIEGKSRVYGSAYVGGSARISDQAQVFSNSQVIDNAHVLNQAIIRTDDKISGEGYIDNWLSSITLRDFNDENSSNYYLLPCPFTFFKDRKGDILVNCDYYTGDLKTFQNLVESISEDCIRIKYRKLIDTIKKFFHKSK